ncbi:MAG TPA: lysoplasmalogenase [Cellulomonas sp.]|uniref:lysoplasmalogenase n=1 Tax=Cellulomonas sp. TaxID=40001 RepID=UPI002E3187E2|nr:lysoplasmalogenase [Cellulomonas sp.]HEX5333357.1 lysoplasmalogenase [Cellulomonas sp.]
MTRARRLWAGSNPRQRAALALFVGLSVVHLGAQLAGVSGLANRSQWFLMPALALVVAVWTARPRTRRVRLVLVALGLSWLGDTVPDLVPDDLSFLVMVGLFLLAQVCYITAFAPGARRSAIARRPALALPYVLVFVVLVVVCAPGAGSVLGPVIVYGACLTTMAALATGLGRIGGIGGAIFLVSDSLIALGAFASGFSLPVAGFWVMSTYLVGQGLLAVAVLVEDRDRRGSMTTAPGQPTAWTGAGSGTPDPSLR